MVKILIIGLNNFSKKIIKYFQNINYEVMGFDFNVDVIDSFRRDNSIINNSKDQLSVLLKESDFIILNLDYSKYQNIFKLSPFIKNDCIITNINTYKDDFEQYKKFLVNKADNFIPSNFLLFPEKVIINYDEDSKMNYIRNISKFYKDANLPTAVLSPKENDIVFRYLFQIPLLIDRLLFKNDSFSLLNDGIDTNMLYEDIFMSKNEITNDLERLIENFPNVNDDEEIIHFIDDNKMINYEIKANKHEITNDRIILKIFMEKILLKVFAEKGIEAHIDLKYFNFDYLNYKSEYLKKYFIENKSNLEVSTIILKEKIISMISFLRFDNLTLDRLLKYL